MKIRHLILLLCIVAGCRHKEGHFRYTNKKHYDSLIVATSQAAFKNQPSFQQAISFNIPDTANVEKEVWDSSLRIIMRMHNWSYQCSPCYESDIIYVGEDDGFEMAFPFFKQSFYDPARASGRVAARNTMKLRLNEYLFTITNRLNINKPEDLVKFSRLFAKLLGLKELTMKDTALLTHTIKRQQHFDSTYSNDDSHLSGYTDSLVMRMKMIRTDLMVNNPDLFYYYTPYVENNVFWQFAVKANGEMNHMEATIVDGDFYIIIRY